MLFSLLFSMCLQSLSALYYIISRSTSIICSSALSCLSRLYSATVNAAPVNFYFSLPDSTVQYCTMTPEKTKDNMPRRRLIMLVSCYLGIGEDNNMESL